jgi:hypothetical protein
MINKIKEMKINVIITGATGMVGEGVLHECIIHPEIDHILLINRKPCGVIHPKVEEIIHNNFFDLSAIEEKLSYYQACFFCLGVTSINKKEPEYFKLTHTLTLHIAEMLLKHNKDLTFCYISGTGTDSTEKGRTMWARIKGKTENDLMKLNFKNVYLFRPGYINPTKGLKNSHAFYAPFSIIYPVLKFLFPKYTSTLKEVALAMINSALKGYEKNILEIQDINKLAKL